MGEGSGVKTVIWNYQELKHKHLTHFVKLTMSLTSTQRTFCFKQVLRLSSACEQSFGF
jgi:hypothetical protein